MNAWEQLMEQDAQNGKKYEIIQQETHMKGMIDIDETSEGTRTLQTEDKLHKNQQIGKSVDKKESRDSPVKLTKALVLLGYSCWSELEPGIENSIRESKL